MAGLRREELRSELASSGQHDPASHPGLDVGDSDHAVLVLQLPSERILAASAIAAMLLAPSGEQVVGRRLTDFTVAGQSEAPHLIVTGQLDGYQTRRARRGGEPAEQLDIWLRATGQRTRAQQALAMIDWPRPAVPSKPTIRAAGPGPVIGATDSQLVLDRVSDNIHSLLGCLPGDVLGQSMLQLVTSQDIASLLLALAQATSSQQGVSLTVRMLRPDARQLKCQLLLLPLAPQPSCAFALQPAQEALAELRSADELRLLMDRFEQAIGAAAAARKLSQGSPSDVRPAVELTTRESQIVKRLLSGDRVPAIARQLFLAQSTVRNHLSTVFAKLGVKSQQELIVLLRQEQSPSKR